MNHPIMFRDRDNKIKERDNKIRERDNKILRPNKILTKYRYFRFHHHIEQYLSKIFQPLTINDYNIKDSLDAVNRINHILQKLFFVSFDVESIFKNVPLQTCLNVIIKRIYDNKLINTNIKKITTHKLIKDTWKKTAFRFDNIIYEQIDGVSMG